MHKQVCEFKRKFQIFGFSCTHGILLLRSAKTKADSTRIDILFTDVRSLELRTFIEPLLIVEVDPSESANRSTKPNETMEHGHKIYFLKSRDWSGCLVAGACRWHTDDLEFGCPSSLTAAFNAMS